MNNSVQPLAKTLEEARKLDHFNFFLLRKDKENLAFGTNQGTIDGIDVPFTEINSWVEDKNKTLIWKTKIINNYELTIGAVTANADYLIWQLNQKKYFFLAEITFVSLFSLGITIYLLKEV